MANLRDIRRRIKSIKNTAQITRAMQLVAASKMKKAQDQATSGRSYADLLNKVLVNLKEQTNEEAHPLLKVHETGKELIVLVKGVDHDLHFAISDAGGDGELGIRFGRPHRLGWKQWKVGRLFQWPFFDARRPLHGPKKQRIAVTLLPSGVPSVTDCLSTCSRLGVASSWQLAV